MIVAMAVTPKYSAAEFNLASLQLLLQFSYRFLCFSSASLLRSSICDLCVALSSLNYQRKSTEQIASSTNSALSRHPCPIAFSPT